MANKIPTENISITVPMSLLAILDNHCAEADLNRSQVANRAIRLYLGTRISQDPSFWEREYDRMMNEDKI